MKFSHKKFFDGYKREFGNLTSADQKTVEGIEFFLSKFDKEKRLNNVPQFAYVLATTFHESYLPRTGVRFQPVKEGRERASSPRRANQDSYWQTGYYGRGFPQTTHKENYLKSGAALGLGDLFVKNPNLLLTPEYAYEAMVICMTKGLYRKGKTLNKFLPNRISTEDQRIAARDIINGDIRKNGKKIADYAQTFERILRESLIDETRRIAEVAEVEEVEKPEEVEFTEGVAPPAPPPPPPAVEVLQVKAEAEPEKEMTGIRASLAGAITFVTTTGAGILSWIAGAKTEIIYGFFGGAAIVGTVFLINRFWYTNREKQREHDARMTREAQAFELQKLTLESAMRRDLNTVTIKPADIKNSETDAKPAMFSGAGGSW